MMQAEYTGRFRWLFLLAAALVFYCPIVACDTDDDDDSSHAEPMDDDDATTPPADDDDDASPNDDDDDDTELPLIAGMYDIAGEDAVWGTYTGQAEIRVMEEGKGLRFIRLADYADADFEGYRVAAAWEGSIAGDETGFTAAADLARIGFIDQYGGETRDTSVVDPLVVAASFGPTGQDIYSGRFLGEDLVDETETWTRIGDNGAAPIWENRRETIDTHPPVPDSLKWIFFMVFHDFHEREEMAPYLDRDDFQGAMHTITIDPTDFEYYQADPGRLRVIQKVIDPISLAETRLRAIAYGLTPAEKAAWFDQNMHEQHINDVGFIANSWYEDGALMFDADMSTMLWTGVYIASQAWRYLETGEAEALDHVVRGLEAQLLAYHIVPEQGAFARSVRAHAEPLPDGWVQGEGDYAIYDYLPGGNNDMLHGYNIAFAFGGLVLLDLPEYADLVADMTFVLDELELYHPEAGDGMIHEMETNMGLYLLTGEDRYRRRYQQLLNNVLYDYFLENLGNGSMYIYGISDWSGNHLNVQTMVVVTMLAELFDDPSLPELREGCRNTYNHMVGPRIPFFMNAMLELGWEDPDPELVEQGLWRLREFRCPNDRVDLDWRINPDFCLSPFPELPWKFDWATEDRFFALHGVPYFEQAIGHFWLRSNPLDNYYDRAGDVSEISAGYLYLYWFLAHRGVL